MGLLVDQFVSGLVSGRDYMPVVVVWLATPAGLSRETRGSAVA